LRYLLDTHILLWWLSAPKKLSPEQARTMHEAERRAETVGLSASSLVEIAVWGNDERQRLDGLAAHIFTELDENPMFQILPITIPIAIDAGALRFLRDPADRTIAATARVHRLRLLTSDRRIIASNLVSVID
jgi:PIN domain nuclease of toxin-antitoxin system